MLMNFFTGVLPFKKYLYQEGQEVDCKLVGANGSVSGGSVIFSFKSRFLEKMIVEAKKRQTGDEIGKPVELDFKLHSVHTLKVNF